MRWAALCFAVTAALAQTPPVTVVVPLPLPTDAGASDLRLSPGPAFGGNVLPYYWQRSLSNTRSNLGFYPGIYSGYFGNGFVNGLVIRSGPQNNPGIAPGPSYANPGQAPPVAETTSPLEVPAVPATPEWANVRSSFSAASVNVSSARTALEELRARLTALGQSPRASLIASVASAEAALKQAQVHMAAGAMDEALTETQRAAYIARQVLKEFGR